MILICIDKDMKKLGFLLKKTREIIGFILKKANLYYYRIGVGFSKGLL